MDTKKILSKGLTVKGLIESLGCMDPDAVVVFRYPSRDYWKTDVARVIAATNEDEVVWSEYHRQLAYLREEDDRTDKELFAVVTLS
jgi:hypothetical protein